ncbi:MAG: hypothetical protein RR840_07105 [Clostridium sp.]
MNWFKKAIAYDQIRKLSLFFILMCIPILIDAVNNYSSITRAELEGILYMSYSNEEMILAIYVISVIISVVSIGVFNRSEVSYLPSMPFKRNEIISTKMVSAGVAVSAPIFIGFIANTLVYFAKYNFLESIGYSYYHVLFKAITWLCIVLFVVALMYLMSVMYGDIKVPFVVFIIGGVSFFYMLVSVLDAIGIGETIRLALEKVGEIIQDGLYFFIGGLADPMVYYPWYRGWIFIAIGIIIAMITLIIFIVNKYSNDIYIRIFPFKISKVLVYTGIYSFVMACIYFLTSTIAVSLLGFHVGSLSESISVYKICVWISVLSCPIIVKITNKIIKKIEEVF